MWPTQVNRSQGGAGQTHSAPFLHVSFGLRRFFLLFLVELNGADKKNQSHKSFQESLSYKENVFILIPFGYKEKKISKIFVLNIYSFEFFQISTFMLPRSHLLFFIGKYSV